MHFYSVQWLDDKYTEIYSFVLKYNPRTHKAQPSVSTPHLILSNASTYLRLISKYRKHKYVTHVKFLAISVSNVLDIQDFWNVSNV